MFGAYSFGVAYFGRAYLAARQLDRPTPVRRTRLIPLSDRRGEYLWIARLAQVPIAARVDTAEVVFRTIIAGEATRQVQPASVLRTVVTTGELRTTGIAVPVLFSSDSHLARTVRPIRPARKA